MKQSLQLKLGQSLTMTPQLQQAIKLLQLHSLELQQEIQQMLESNPMLEQEELGEDSSSAENADNLAEPSSDIDLNQDNAVGADDSPVDSVPEDHWEPISSGAAAPTGDGDRDIWDTQAGIPPETLQDHLLWQLQMAHLSPVDEFIADSIIDCINDDGFLTESLDSIHSSVVREFEDVELDEVVAVLHRIQHLDPLGVGATSIEDCLVLQLDALPPETPHIQLAKEIVSEHIQLLASHDYARLKRALKVKEENLAEAVQLIQSLNPKPGASMASDRVEYIVPDVFVSKVQGRWQVELNPDLAPKLHINQLYAEMAKNSGKGADGNYLRDNLQEARWFIKSLLSRNETILKTAQSIVARQRAFFDYGEEAMKPLVLREIAEDIEMHESTISRVTTQKYMHTPRGIFELKYFFSSHVSTSDGGECSATAIRAMIKKLISEENTSKPLSDSKLAKILEEQGINVARRTVAKYREAMQFPPSNERKRLN